VTPPSSSPRRPVPRDLLRPAGAGRLLWAALADWGVIALCWAAMAHAPAAVVAPAILVIAGRLHALGVVLHDACHRRRTAGAPWRILEVVAGLPVTTTLAGMRYHHLRHHRHVGTRLDPYWKPGASERWEAALAGRLRGLLLPAAWVVRCAVGTLALAAPHLREPYARVFLGDRSPRSARDDAELDACLKAEPAQLLFFAALVPVALAWPLAFALGYALPLCIAGLCNAHRVIAEHEHVLVDGTLSAVVGITHTRGAWWNRWLLYPRNIGYHVVHHVYPTAPLHTLPRLQAWYDGGPAAASRP
jgi:fatty acid desaturase